MNSLGYRDSDERQKVYGEILKHCEFEAWKCARLDRKSLGLKCDGTNAWFNELHSWKMTANWIRHWIILKNGQGILANWWLLYTYKWIDGREL